MKRLVPVSTKMLVARQEFDYKGAIIVPEIAKSKTTVGTIISIGEEVTKYSPGTKILFTRFSGIVFTVIDRTHPRANKDTGEVEFIVLDESEVFTKIEEVLEGESAIETFND